MDDQPPPRKTPPGEALTEEEVVELSGYTMPVHLCSEAYRSMAWRFKGLVDRALTPSQSLASQKWAATARFAPGSQRVISVGVIHAAAIPVGGIESSAEVQISA